MRLWKHKVKHKRSKIFHLDTNTRSSRAHLWASHQAWAPTVGGGCIRQRGPSSELANMVSALETAHNWTSHSSEGIDDQYKLCSLQWRQHTVLWSRITLGLGRGYKCGGEGIQMWEGGWGRNLRCWTTLKGVIWIYYIIFIYPICVW